ncbi:MAG: hypothetical protein A2V70_09015 [Planctomycetes bacterium RBG_13_63_9]|nr:MAG: hypothetical protein A2V70_09015 [Planctomycetes bacterium RBG_13_63_9]
MTKAGLMRRSSWCRRLLAGSLLAACFCAVVRPVAAKEESQRFLDGLRQRGLYDMALEYLEQMRTSPLAPDDFKAVIDYEVGVTLTDSSRMGRETAAREKQLSDAKAMLEKFLAERPEHPLAPGAETRLADLLAERGRILVEQAGRPDRSAEEKTALRSQARVFYREAQNVLAGLEKAFLKKHKEFGLVDPSDTKRIEQRDRIRRDLLDARLALATVVYEIGMAYDPQKRKESREQHLNDAASQYGQLYQKYERHPAGLYARMWEGRCYRELGETDKAFAAFEEVMAQPGEAEAFRRLRDKALILLLETALLPDVKEYQKAVDKVRKWEQSAIGREQSSSDGLAIQCLAGEAALECARTLDKREEGDARAQYLKEAKQYFSFIVRFPGAYQQKARGALRAKEFVGEDYVQPEPTSFAEARDLASEKLDQSRNADLTDEQIAAARRDAIKYYRMALGMRTPEVSPEEINLIRYRLAFLYLVTGDLYEAAVAGEFLARRYPNGPGSRQAAVIAMAAYVELLREAPPDDRQFVTDRMTAIADYIAERWQGQPEADDARMRLIHVALDNGELEKAQAYLDTIPADSPRRGEAELMTGQKLWATYLQAAGKEEAELDQMVQQAQQVLEAGIARMRKPVDQGAEPSYTLVASVLSLAQICNGAADAAKAVTWLEDPKICALELVKKNHPATDRGNFRVETYKAALRAYVAARQVEKAEEVMTALEKQVQEDGTAQDQSKLTRIYISLGRGLQGQLERLRKQQKTDQLQEVSEGFRRFLERISQRKEGNTFNSLYWVAETFLGLASGLDPGGATLPPEAEQYYREAAETYSRMLNEIADGTMEAPSADTTSIKIRRAKCLRRLGQFKEAMAGLLQILTARGNLVSAQVEVAYTYQAWGQQKPGYYGLAINGSSKYKQIWGWAKTARMVAHNQKYRSVFHEARYNLALCRFNWALTQPKAEKAAMLAQAEKDILVVQRLYPEMGKGLYLEPGGKDWRQKYDDLLRNIQRLRGKKVVGLETNTAKKGASR